MTPLENIEKSLKEAKVPYRIDRIYYKKAKETVIWLTFEENFDCEGNEICIPFYPTGYWMSDNTWQKIAKYC